ncbi:hypothetical protein P8X24_10910 [Pyrococcus kukulkanii]|uniref:hypothetical protein n=1 Tax=Pyrococcus kukulkanii TaxID=1609559 RepID=UPI0035642DD5
MCGELSLVVKDFGRSVAEYCKKHEGRGVSILNRLMIAQDKVEIMYVLIGLLSEMYHNNIRADSAEDFINKLSEADEKEAKN